MKVHHRFLIGLLLIAACLAYTVLAIADPATATALATGFILFVIVGGGLLRTNRGV